MPVQVYCKSCDRTFTPTAEKLLEMIREALGSKEKTLVLHSDPCARCESQDTSREPAETKSPAVRLMRCPEAGCSGWVARYVDAQGTHHQCWE